MCDGRWTTPYTDQTVASRNAPGELRPQILDCRSASACRVGAAAVNQAKAEAAAAEAGLEKPLDQDAWC